MVALGLTRKQAEKLKAAIALAVAVHEDQATMTPQPRLNSPESSIAYCQTKFWDLIHNVNQEEFWVVTLNTKMMPIQHHRITVGTLANSLVHPREVFRPAILDSAYAIIGVHNHPSGDPTPSDMDYSVSAKLEQAGEIIGIRFLDHVVVAKFGCRSCVKPF